MLRKSGAIHIEQAITNQPHLALREKASTLSESYFRLASLLRVEICR